MSVAIKIPSVGESITEAIIAQWLIDDGEFVEEGNPVLELETDKASQEIPAPGSGILSISVEEGETVSIGDEVGSIDPDKAKGDGKKADKSSKDKKEKSEEQKEPEGKNERPKDKKPSKDEGKDGDHAAAAFSEEMTLVPGDEPPPLPPSVRRIVQEKKIDITQVKGSGRGGRVTKEDVLGYLEEQEDKEGRKDGSEIHDEQHGKFEPPPERRDQPPVESATADIEAGPVHREKMSAIRQRIAQKLVSSQQSTATLTTFNEADMSAVLALRSKFKETFKKKYDVSLGFMSFFVKASIEALKAFPKANGHIDGNEIVMFRDYNIGVAVSTDKGLMVPVVRNAGTKGFAEIEKVINKLAAKAREGKISPDDLQGGTFTITNGGVFGSLLSTPILYPGQSGILGMHTIQKRPVAIDDQVVIRPMMYLAFSYDHRLIDGKEAVQFLIRIKECIEDPERMLLEI